MVAKKQAAKRPAKRAVKKAAAKPRTTNGGRTTPKKTVATVSDFKTKVTDLELPSGKICQVRKPQGMQMFLANGTIPNALLPIVGKSLEGEDAKPPELANLLEEGEKLQAVFDLADSVVVQTVVAPKVNAVPTTNLGTSVPMGERCEFLGIEGDDDDLLWVDEVDLEDKMFIFMFAVGGSRDIERFREGSAEAMGGLSSVV